MTTQELINCYCVSGTRMSGKNIPIKAVVDDALRTVLFTMQRLAGSQGPHQAYRVHLLYAIEAMAPTIFNWAKALLSVFKDQLNKCRQAELKQFGYGSILACFFFERVPHTRPQVIFIELRARDPRMLRWVECMACTGGGRVKVKYEFRFFHWLDD